MALVNMFVLAEESASVAYALAAMYCIACNRTDWETNIELHHSHRVSDGNTAEGDVPLCEDCHRAEHAHERAGWASQGGKKAAVGGGWVHNLRQYRNLTDEQKARVVSRWYAGGGVGRVLGGAR